MLCGMAVVSNARSRLYAIAEQQAGYFTAMQAREAGYSFASQSYQHKAGHWQRDGWGIYRLTRFPNSSHEELVRLSLWSRTRQGEGQAVVSHASALELYDLSDVLPAFVHLTVPRGFRKQAPRGVLLHRSNLEEHEVHRWEGISVTAPIRTLLDVADASISDEHLQDATLQALDRGLIRRGVLAQALKEARTNVVKLFSFLTALD